MKTMLKTVMILLTLNAMLCKTMSLAGQSIAKNRMIVVTDIGNEPDDFQSMIRLILYSNPIDIEGLIASTSVHQKSNVHPELIQKVILSYGKIRSNLLKHEQGFPTAKRLAGLVKQGLPVYGLKGVGIGNDSEGSEWIIKSLERNDDRPLWVTVWGGSNTLAQALWKIRVTKSETETKRLSTKLRVYTISDQDDSGAWIRKNFPELFYIVSPGKYEDAIWSAIFKVIPGANNEVISNEWLLKNIQQGHGPLGALYPDVAFGMEGDTPSFLMLIPNGLNAPEHPDWGSWGGRYELYKPPFDPKVRSFVPHEEETRPIWTDAKDEFTPWLQTKWGRAVLKDTISYTGNYVTLWRWREHFQNDFVARMSWCTAADFKSANHPPVVKLNTPEHITVKSGETIPLDGNASYDPDGDGLSFQWFQYTEVGTYKKNIVYYLINTAELKDVRAPSVESPQSVHFILAVTDKGTPRLSRYKRVIVDIVPR